MPSDSDLPPTSEPGSAGIPLHVPEIRGNEWAYIKECLETNWVSSVGPFVDRFERDLADYVGTKHGVAVVNGTAALHIALLVAGVQPEDEVLVSTLTFIASANAIRYCGAHPVFMDAEPDYWQMDPEKVSDFLETGCEWKNGQLWNKSSKRRVTAIMPVHILGHPVDMDPILELARRFNLLVVEDATEAIGAKYKGNTVGSLGDIACFSFNGNKLITAGGGGMIVTHKEEWARRARHLTTQAKADPVEYIHDEIGFNYRLTNIQAAMGCAQLEQLESYVEIKRSIARRYDDALVDIPGITPMMQAPWAESNFWLYTVLVEEERFGMSSRALLGSLAAQNIQARPLWQPLHLSPAYAGHVLPGSNAEQIYHKAVSIPCSVAMTHEQQMMVVNLLQEYSTRKG
jgi:perosamine synthetase